MSSPYSTPPPSTLLPDPQFAPSSSGRPTGVTVFAILGILFGIMGLLGTLFSVSMLFIGGSLGPNPVLDVLQTSTGYRVFFIASIILGFIFSFILLIAGIGLLKMSKLARKLAIAYAVYAVIAAIVGNAVNVFVVFLPMMQQASGQQGPQMAVMVGSMIGAVVGGFAGLIFPVALLVYFLRTSVKETFDRWEDSTRQRLVE